jgi:hypothetical protein
MHYIFNKDKDGNLDLDNTFIPSEGMAHPLMTTTFGKYAN